MTMTVRELWVVMPLTFWLATVYFVSFTWRWASSIRKIIRQIARGSCVSATVNLMVGILRVVVNDAGNSGLWFIVPLLLGAFFGCGYQWVACAIELHDENAFLRKQLADGARRGPYRSDS